MPVTARSLANATPATDNANVGVANRGSKYGEQYVIPLLLNGRQGLADEGSYFIATNPTPGTAFAYNVQASFSDTVPFLYLFNGAAAGGKNVELDYIKLIVTTAAASGVTAYYAARLDASRAITSDNTTKVVPVNYAGTATVLSPLKLQNGSASTIAASSSTSTIVARGSFGGITIVGDELVMCFGGDPANAYPGLTAAQATAPGRKVSVSGPVIVAPQQSLTIHLWFASNAITGLSYEFEMGWAER